MKKIFFAALMITGAHFANAQVNKGQWLAGGNIGFESAKQGEAGRTEFNFSPNAGYFFINNFAGGLRVDVTTGKVKDAEDGYSSFAVAPFLRYYFLPSAKKVNVFADAAYGFGSVKDGGESASMNEYAISAGPAIFLTPSAALEFSLYYKSRGGEAYEVADKRLNRFGLNIGFQVHLGK